MADRVATSDDTSAGGAPAEEGLRAVRKARRELLAVLAPLVITVAVLIAGYGFLVFDVLRILSMPPSGGPDLGLGAAILASVIIFALALSSFILFPILSACFLGMRIIFKSIRGSNPLSMRLAYILMVGMLVAAATALLMGSLVFVDQGGAELRFAVPAGIACALVGFRLMWVRYRRLGWLAGAAGEPRPRPPISRRRVLAEAALGIAALAAGAVAAASLSGTDLAANLALLPFLLSLLLPFLFLPLALMSSDAYHHRRKRLDLGPDMRLGQVIAGMAAAAVLAAAVLAAAAAALLIVLI